MENFKETLVYISSNIETIDEKNIVIRTEPSQIKEVAKLLEIQGARFIHLTAIDFISQKNKIELNYFFSIYRII